MADDSQESRFHGVRWAVACVVLLVAVYVGSYFASRDSSVFASENVILFDYSRFLPQSWGRVLCTLHRPLYACEGLLGRDIQIDVSFDGIAMYPVVAVIHHIDEETGNPKTTWMSRPIP